MKLNIVQDILGTRYRLGTAVMTETGDGGHRAIKRSELRKLLLEDSSLTPWGFVKGRYYGEWTEDWLVRVKEDGHVSIGCRSFSKYATRRIFRWAKDTK